MKRETKKMSELFNDREQLFGYFRAVGSVQPGYGAGTKYERRSIDVYYYECLDTHYFLTDEDPGAGNWIKVEDIFVENSNFLLTARSIEETKDKEFYFDMIGEIWCAYWINPSTSNGPEEGDGYEEVRNERMKIIDEKTARKYME